MAENCKWGLRIDGTCKGDGWFNPIKVTDNDGNTKWVTEYTIGDKDNLMPVIVPTLNKDQFRRAVWAAANNEDVDDDIAQTAIAWAKQRRKVGLSPFIHKGEKTYSRPDDPNPQPRTFGNAKGQEYAKLAQENPNVRFFLDLISMSEGGKVRPTTYTDAIGFKKFDDLSKHPRMRDKKLDSDASGRNQMLGSIYNKVAEQLGYKGFSPEEQDGAAVKLLDEIGALKDIMRGDMISAAEKFGNRWASAPSSHFGQTKGQIPWEKIYEFCGIPYTQEAANRHAKVKYVPVMKNGEIVGRRRKYDPNGIAPNVPSLAEQRMATEKFRRENYRDDYDTSGFSDVIRFDDSERGRRLPAKLKEEFAKGMSDYERTRALQFNSDLNNGLRNDPELAEFSGMTPQKESPTINNYMAQLQQLAYGNPSLQEQQNELNTYGQMESSMPFVGRTGDVDLYNNLGNEGFDFVPPSDKLASFAGYGNIDTSMQIADVFNNLAKQVEQPLEQVKESAIGKFIGAMDTLDESPYPLYADDNFSNQISALVKDVANRK